MCDARAQWSRESRIDHAMQAVPEFDPKSGMRWTDEGRREIAEAVMRVVDDRHGSCQEHGCQWPKGLGRMLSERDRYREALAMIEMQSHDSAAVSTATEALNGSTVRSRRDA